MGCDRVASLENGSDWLEPLLLRLALNYKKMPNSFKQDPVESFKKHVFVSPFYEDPVARLIELIGVERILFGSDWPHPEGLGTPLDFSKDIDHLNDEQIKRIMHTNMKGLIEGARD